MAQAYFDSHCHLQDPAFAGRIPAVLERAQAAGVTHLACCATRETDWDEVLDLAAGHACILPLLGLHPWWVDQAAPGWLERLRNRLGTHRAGVGECGLDFSPGRPDRDVQEAAFGAQLRLACELDRPVSIHCVGAWERLLAVLRASGVPAGTVLHAFSGSTATAAELQALGLHFSFSASALRPGARRGTEALAAVRADRLLFETDAPGGAGQAREPAGLPQVLHAAAERRGAAPDALAAFTHDNALRVFRSLLP